MGCPSLGAEKEAPVCRVAGSATPAVFMQSVYDPSRVLPPWGGWLTSPGPAEVKPRKSPIIVFNTKMNGWQQEQPRPHECAMHAL